MNNKEFIDAMKYSINLNKDDIVEMTKFFVNLFYNYNPPVEIESFEITEDFFKIIAKYKDGETRSNILNYK